MIYKNDVFNECYRVSMSFNNNLLQLQRINIMMFIDCFADPHQIASAIWTFKIIFILFNNCRFICLDIFLLTFQGARLASHQFCIIIITFHTDWANLFALKFTFGNKRHNEL